MEEVNLIIKEKAKELVRGALSEHELSENINNFVRDSILYCLDEWDVKPIEVLKKGRGMCAGKALLAAELHGAVGISTRFKVMNEQIERIRSVGITGLKQGLCLE